MTINVSGLGITTGNSYGTKADYLSINERLNQKPVGKVDAVKSATSGEAKSVAEEARQRYVAETTPTDTIGMKSAGKVAEQTFLLMQKNTEATSKIAAELRSSESKPYITNEDEADSAADITEESENENTVVEADETSLITDNDEETKTTPVSTQSLTGYSEYELRKMVTDGDITPAEMDAELKSRESAEESGTVENRVETAQSYALKNAIAAYNYQMSYQINAMAVQ